MAANVTMIPPREVRPETLRVAAYCRVSTDSADQLHSYAAQIKHYTELIGNHEGWELADVYADEGLTGTRMDKREDFNRMMADCRKGRIDKVLVKSISRFARNTRDCLSAMRELARLGVTIRFEENNIDTATLTTEFMVSVFGSLAQEESVSISRNLRMSYQRRMEKGEFITTNPPLGYELADGCMLKIKEDEAETVRCIFHTYLTGASTRQIAAALTEQGVRTTEGNTVWNPRSVQLILTNEKYMGDTLCKKRYTTNTLPFTLKRNHGEANQYYIENSHPAIVTREVFEQVQALRLRRLKKKETKKQTYPLTLKIICGNCGTVHKRRVTRNGLVSWVCGKHDERSADCPMGRIPETEIYAAFVRMYNKLRRHQDIVLKPAMKQLEELNAALQRDDPAMLAVNKAIAQATEQSYNISKLQNSGLLDDDAGAAKQNAISAQLTRLRAERRRLLKHGDIEEAMDSLRRMADIVRHGPERLETFDEELFNELVERIIAESRTRIRFRLKGGIELAEQLWEVAR